MSEIGRKVDRPAPSKSSGSQNPMSTPSFEANFPSLWLFLNKERDFGEKHKTGCFTVFVEGERLKLCLNDRPCRQSAFLAGHGLLEVLARADRGLLEGSLNWTKASYRRRSRV